MSKPSQREWTDEYTLLCEKCGYVIEGLDTEGHCPECGKPVEESLPRKRDGSPWQQGTTPGTVLRTWIMLLRHPKRCWETLNINQESGISLMGWGLALGMLSSAITVLALTILITSQTNDADVLVSVIGIILAACVIFMFTAWIYAGLAVLRIRFWANHRGYRITKPIAWTIIGHASFGLALIPLIVFAGFLNMLIAGLMIYIEGTDIFDSTNSIPVVLIYGGYFMILASIPAGLTVFEILCLIGFRRMRYRNASRHTNPRPLYAPDPPVAID
jgi:hypothetical protein